MALFPTTEIIATCGRVVLLRKRYDGKCSQERKARACPLSHWGKILPVDQIQFSERTYAPMEARSLGLAAIENFLSGVQHPIAFLDYEKSAAHPITNVTGPPHCGTENLAPTGRRQPPNFALCGRFYRFRWG